MASHAAGSGIELLAITQLTEEYKTNSGLNVNTAVSVRSSFSSFSSSYQDYSLSCNASLELPITALYNILVVVCYSMKLMTGVQQSVYFQFWQLVATDRMLLSATDLRGV